MEIFNMSLKVPLIVSYCLLWFILAQASNIGQDDNAELVGHSQYSNVSAEGNQNSRIGMSSFAEKVVLLQTKVEVGFDLKISNIIN